MSPRGKLLRSDFGQHLGQFLIQMQALLAGVFDPGFFVTSIGQRR